MRGVRESAWWRHHEARVRALRVTHQADRARAPLRRPRRGECIVRGCSVVHRVEAYLIDLEAHRNPPPVLCAVSGTSRRECTTRFPVAPAAWPNSSRPGIASEFVSTNSRGLSFHWGRGSCSAQRSVEHRRISDLPRQWIGEWVGGEIASSDPPRKSDAPRAGLGLRHSFRCT
jgi:hypothetical protein